MSELVKIEDNKIVVDKLWLDKYRWFKKIQLDMELAEKQFKEDLKEKMEEVGLNTVIGDGFYATVKKATTRTSLDTKKLKAELPDIFEEYSKVSDVKSSITVNIE